jgi:hypothetical protein
LTADIINRANDAAQFGALMRPALRNALLEVARGRHGDIDPVRLGRWLAKAENNVAGGLKLTADRGDPTRPRWVLVDA